MKALLPPALFLLEFLSLSDFFSGPGRVCLAGRTGGPAAWLSLFVLLLLLETAFASWLTRRRGADLVRPVLASHLPWLLAWAAPWVAALTLPDPQNFTLRKLQVLLGVMLLSHLFLFTRFLLSASYKNGWKASKVFGWTALFLFVGATCWTASVCDLSGDEPHYLLMAYSLIHDHDLDLSNNYRNGDYEAFYHRGKLEPQALEHVIGGRRYSHHPLGPVLLVLPGFALAGRMGAALTMALLAALALYLTLRVLEETGAGGWPLHAVGVIGLFSSPFLLFAGIIYPEIPTACLAALALLFFLRRRWGWTGFCLGSLLWMHNRDVLLVIPLGLACAYEVLWKEGKGRWAAAGRFLLGSGLPLAALTLYFRSLYGVWTPLGAQNEPFTSLFRLGHFWAGFFGLALDQECGLWFHFPVFALMVTGGILMARSSHPLRNPVLGTVAFYYLFMSFYENLGLTPAARYMVSVTPLLLVLLHPVLEGMRKRDVWTSLAVLSFGAGALVNWVLAAVPWMRYNKLDGENWMLKIAGNYLHLPLTSWEPAFNPPVVEPKSYVMGALWMAGTVVLSVLFLKYGKKTD